MLNFFFGFTGRIRRSSYFFGALAAMLLWTVICVSALVAIGVANRSEEHTSELQSH